MRINQWHMVGEGTFTISLVGVLGLPAALGGLSTPAPVF
jgi:hypothetical protein